jgi:uncharacterized protein (DUF1697 family)
MESLGHTGVSTLLQSGNVIFTAATPVSSESLEAAIESRFGVAVAVMLRKPAELRRVMRTNPFPAADTSKLHVGFMAAAPASAALAKLDRQRFLPEEFVVKGAELYLHLPNGMGRTKLPGYLDRRLKIATTIRTWNTVAKLVDLTGG